MNSMKNKKVFMKNGGSEINLWWVFFFVFSFFFCFFFLNFCFGNQISVRLVNSAVAEPLQFWCCLGL